MGIQHKKHIEFLGSLNHSYVKKETSPNETTQIQSSPVCVFVIIYIVVVLFSFRSMHYHFTILIAMHFIAQITKTVQTIYG